MRQQNSNGGRRPRGRTNNRKQHSGGQHRSGTYDSNGPDGRIRGNASQVYEKYVGLARDATSAGDRIAAEAYYQHAEHYYRIVNDSTDPESPGSQRSQNVQPGQAAAAPQANGEIEVAQTAQGSQGGNQSGRDHQGRQDRSDRPGRDRPGYQDRRSRGPSRNDAEVPGLEPQPDLPQGNTPAFAERTAQNELPLSSDDGAPRRGPQGGRSGERGRGRPRAVDPAPAATQTKPDDSVQRGVPSLEDSIPAAIAPAASEPQAATNNTPVSEAAPVPKKRGRPRKRPLEETQDAAPAKAADSSAAAADTGEPAAAAPVKRRGRPRKVVVEAAPASESDDSPEGPSAANA